MHNQAKFQLAGLPLDKLIMPLFCRYFNPIFFLYVSLCFKPKGLSAFRTDKNLQIKDRCNRGDSLVAITAQLPALSSSQISRTFAHVPLRSAHIMGKSGKLG